MNVLKRWNTDTHYVSNTGSAVFIFAHIILIQFVSVAEQLRVVKGLKMIHVLSYQQRPS